MTCCGWSVGNQPGQPRGLACRAGGCAKSGPGVVVAPATGAPFGIEPVCLRVQSQRAQVGGEVVGGVEGVGVVLAEGVAAAGEGVLVQVAGGGVLAEEAQVDGEVVGGVEGVGVVLAEGVAAAGEGILVQVAGGGVLAEEAQVSGE